MSELFFCRLEIWLRERERKEAFGREREENSVRWCGKGDRAVNRFKRWRRMVSEGMEEKAFWLLNRLELSMLGGYQLGKEHQDAAGRKMCCLVLSIKCNKMSRRSKILIFK